MNRQPNMEALANGTRNIYKQDPQHAQDALERYLLEELAGFSTAERLKLMVDLLAQFNSNLSNLPVQASVNDEQLQRFCSLLLGYSVDETELESEIIQERLTEALTTIFETLNQLIRTINLTLLEGGQSQETIRFLIGEQLDGNRDMTSLDEHLGQISTAFVTSHRAFKRAVQVIVEKILDELDPKPLQKSQQTGYKPGLFRKAENFDSYVKSFEECRKWYDSGRCMQEFLHTFEKQCTEISKLQRR